MDWVSAECPMLFLVRSWFYRKGFRLCSTCYSRFVFFFASLDQDTKGSDNSMFLIIVLLTEPPTWLYATDKHLIVILHAIATVYCICNDRFKWSDTQYWKKSLSLFARKTLFPSLIHFIDQHVGACYSWSILSIRFQRNLYSTKLHTYFIHW